jgi:hypothetical protein
LFHQYKFCPIRQEEGREVALMRTAGDWLDTHQHIAYNGGEVMNMATAQTFPIDALPFEARQTLEQAKENVEGRGVVCASPHFGIR